MTQEIILATRNHFAEIHQGCIDQATAGVFYVNDLAKYVEDQEYRRKASLAGFYDHTFTFQQRAHWMKTGESVAFMS